MNPKGDPHASGRPRSETPCKYFKVDNCTNKQCPFLHDKEAEIPTRNAPCMEFKITGRCPYGRSCHFRHEPGQITLGEEIGDVLMEPLKPKESDTTVSQRQNLASYNWMESPRPLIMVPGLCCSHLVIHF